MITTTSSSGPSGEVFVPPINFSMLCSGVYRSGYPTKKNFRFLKALNLRSICYLCPEEYAQTNLKFCEESGIRVLRFPMEGNKEPFVDIPENTVHRALTALCDTRNHPILVHCNKGKHRTGTICACLRRVQGWSLVSIFDEYLRFAGDKARVGDQQYAELYRPIVLIHDAFAAPWLERTAAGTTFVHTEEAFHKAAIAQAECSVFDDRTSSSSASVAAKATATPLTASDEAAAAAAKAAKKEAKRAAAAAAAASDSAMGSGSQ